MSKYIIIFLVVFMSFFGIYNVTTDTQIASTIKNMEYSDYLSSASFDAVKEMKKNGHSDILMTSTLDRERVIGMFFNSLAMDFGYDTNEDLTMLRMYVPVVAMIDTNGYYICYNIKYQDNDGHTHLKSAITEINTWADKQDRYTIKYNLGKQVTVTDIYNGNVIEGKYTEVFKKLGSPNSLKAIMDSGDDAFIQHRNEVIIPQIQETIEYYINNHNEVASQLQSDYLFEMPMTSKDEWVRVLENPTVIAFMQGMRLNNSQDYLNIYALSGGEVKKTNPIVFKEDTAGANSIKNYYQDKDQLLVGSDQNGYYANDKIVAMNNDEVIHNDTQDISGSTTLRDTQHIHWGSSTAGTGCYAGGAPIYHVHNASCYTVKRHHHTADCYADVVHYHTRDCYEYVMHHHTGSETSGGGCYSKPVYHEHTSSCLFDGGTLDPNGKCRLGLSTSSIIKYELNCDYWDMDHLTTEQQNMLDEGHLRSVVQTFPDYIAASAAEKERISQEYIESSISYVYGKCIETAVLTCGKDNGVKYGNILICGKTDGEEEGYEITCGKTGEIEGYSLNCGHEQGEWITSAEAAVLNEH